MTTSIKISLTQVGQQALPGQAIDGMLVRQVLTGTHRTYRKPVIAVVVVHVLVVRVEVEVPRVVRIVRIQHTRPVVAVLTRVVETRTVAVASGGQAACELTLVSVPFVYNIFEICCFTSERNAMHSIGECCSTG